ncbi:MAG: glycine betaine ABC transporter substrate-binding protein [Planctomycetes bacterium]|nr:glycine betaine ABC transporter substrate-binding protein [Planctomycetota bacterium]
MKITAITLAVIFALAFGYSGVQFYANAQDVDEGDGVNREAEPIKLAYVEWDSEVASTYVVKAILETRLGYETELISVSAPEMWQTIAEGVSDATASAWLPTLHAEFLEANKDKVVDLGANLVGTRSGLVVPSYVPIDSISELAWSSSEFDGRIVGIEPDAGIMRVASDAMYTYGLDRFDLITGTDDTMIAELEEAIRLQRNIVITGWTPHWMFQKFDLRYLDDPKGIFGREEEIHTIVRLGLDEEHPDVYKLLDNFEFTVFDAEWCMLKNQEPEADPYETALEWIEQNEETVDSWLSEEPVEEPEEEPAEEEPAEEPSDEPTDVPMDMPND